VLALLAFTCFPVLAQAETVYETEQTNLPGSGGEKTPPHHKNPGSSESSPHADQSGVPGGGGGESGGGGHPQPESSKSQNGPSQESNPSTPGGGGEAKGKAGNGATKGQKSPKPVQLGEPQSSTSDSGGSSPLVPILIAVAVLAAISIGTVLVRQRRGSADGFSLKRG
jgi:cobalamin biosynthesis Mg chelatase CobN